MKRFSVGLVLCVLCFIDCSSAWARVWTDLAGNQVNGSFKGFNAQTGMVSISQNNRRIPVLFSDLCREDRDYVISELRKTGREKQAERFDTEIPDPSTLGNQFNGPGANPGAVGAQAGARGQQMPGTQPNLPGAAGMQPGIRFPGQPGVPPGFNLPNQPGMAAGAGVGGGPLAGAQPNFPAAGAMPPGAQFPAQPAMPQNPAMPDSVIAANSPAANAMPGGAFPGSPMPGNPAGSTSIREPFGMNNGANSWDQFSDRLEESNRHAVESINVAAENAQQNMERHQQMLNQISNMQMVGTELICDHCKSTFSIGRYHPGDPCPNCNGAKSRYSSANSGSRSSDSGTRFNGRAIGRIVALVIAAVGGLIGFIKRMSD